MGSTSGYAFLDVQAANDLIADVTGKRPLVAHDEEDCCDALRLVADVRLWVEHINIGEAIADPHA